MKRIQRKRSKGWRLPENAVCITRRTKYGNPMKIVQMDDASFGKIFVLDFEFNYWADTGLYGDITDMLHMFDLMLRGQVFMNTRLQVWSDYFSKLDLTPLIGHDLACFCKEGDPCHGDCYINFIQEKYEKQA